MKWFDIAEELLPPVYKSIKDMYCYAQSLDNEFRKYVSYLEAILNNLFIQSCDTQTVDYWERLLKITPKPEQTLDERKAVILEYLNNQNPTTEPYVREVLARMFPNDEIDLHFDTLHDNPYDLSINIFTEDLESLEEFKEWFSRKCPAHINYEIAKGIKTEFERPVVTSHSILSASEINLGLVSYQEPQWNSRVWDALNHIMYLASHHDGSDNITVLFDSGEITMTLNELYSLSPYEYGIVASEYPGLWEGESTVFYFDKNRDEFANRDFHNAWLSKNVFEEDYDAVIADGKTTVYDGDLPFELLYDDPDT